MKGTELADAIRDEMAKSGNSYIEMMGEMMTEYLRMHPETEIDDRKNLKGAFDALKNAARKKQKGGCYAMPPREVFGGMMEYFALSHADADFRACMAALIGQEIPAVERKTAISQPTSPTDSFAQGSHKAAGEKRDMDDLFDLDALLGV